MPQLVPAQVDGRGEHRHHIHHVRRVGLPTRERLEVSNDVPHPTRALSRFVQLRAEQRNPVFVEWTVELLAAEAHVGEHISQRVVQLVRDTRGERAH